MEQALESGGGQHRMRRYRAYFVLVRRFILLTVLLVQTGVCLSFAADQDWPQWRGPNRDGTAVGVKLPDPWPTNLKELWKVEVGEGDSSPVVAGDKLVLMARKGENEIVFCFGADDGREIWRHSYAAPYTPRSAARGHNGPLSTPTISGEKVYTFGTTGVLNCFDFASGKVLWRKQFSSEFSSTFPIWGAANSPLIENDLCILGVGGQHDGALAAFDKDTGRVVWQFRGDGPGYSSPIVTELAGVRQVTTLMQTRVAGVETNAGKLLWEIPFETQYEMNIITPLVHKEMVIYSGFKQPTSAARVVKSRGKISAEPVWSNPELSMYTSSPVLHEDSLYGLSMKGKGRLMCIGLDDGQERWTSPTSMGRQVSIVKVEGKLLVLTFDGDLVVIAADPSEYRELGRTKVVDGPVWAHHALTEDCVYVKDSTHLTCFALRGR